MSDVDIHHAGSNRHMDPGSDYYKKEAVNDEDIEDLLVEGNF